MNSSVRSVFVRKSSAALAIIGLLALSTPFTALANQTVTVSLTSSAPTSPAHTAQNPIPVTATFSEAVSNFDASKVTVTNGSVTNFAASSTAAGVYTFGIVPASSGSTTVVSIAADSANGTDPVHTNFASNQLQFVIDPTAGDFVNVSSHAFLSLDNYSGIPGTTFNAIGSQFNGLEVVHVGFGAATSSVTTQADGSFTLPFTASSGMSGPTQLTAIGASSGLVATTSFYVNPAPVVITPAATSTSTGPNAPVITITSGPAEGSTVSTTTVTFAFTVNDPTATTTCTFGGTFLCGSPVTLGPLGNSVYVFSVTAASSTGIATSSVNFTVLAATTTPVTPTPPPTTPTTPTVSGGGGGGGGGYVASGPLSIGYVNNTQNTGTTPTAPQGQVLGTSTVSYTFVKPLKIGSRGADVTALQTILISAGYLVIPTPTGYFGSMTFAAVKKYQKAHGLEQVGSVGPLTRAALNKGQ